jgi:predicted transcriptional regulator
MVMSKIRDIILSHMNASNVSIYRISKMVEGKVAQRTVYDFLSGKSDTSTEVAWILMDALGLTITNKNIVKRTKRPRKEQKK